MRNTTHTPGPWRVVDHGAAKRTAQVVAPERGEVCYLSQLRIDARTSHAERLANARLIAAAPDLLAALRPFAEEADGRPHRDEALREQIEEVLVTELYARPLISPVPRNCVRAADRILALLAARDDAYTIPVPMKWLRAARAAIAAAETVG